MPLIRKERAASDGTVGPSGDRASQSSVHWAAIKAAKRAAREAGAPAEPATPTTTKDSGAGFGSDMSAEESAATFAPPPPTPQQAPAAAAPATAGRGAAPVPRSGPAPPHGAACDAPGCPGTRPARAAIPLCRACTLLFVRHLNQDAKYRQVRDALLGEWISARQLAEAEEAMAAIGAEPEAEGAEGDAASAD